jgi:hypothetical protein
MGTVKAVVGILAILAVVLIVFEVAPPMAANYSFQDDLKTVSLMDSGNQAKTEDDVRNDVVRKAKEHDLAITPAQVKVERINSPGVSTLYLSVDYSVPVSLPGYPFDMHFSPNSGNK